MRIIIFAFCISLLSAGEEKTETALNISGRVLSGTGKQPVAGAGIKVYNELGRGGGATDWLFDLLDRERLKKPVLHTITDANGFYVLENLQEDKNYAVQVIAKGYRFSTRKFVKAGSRNVDFQLKDGITLNVQVVNYKKEPLKSAAVSVYPDTEGKSLREAVTLSMRGAVDKAGTDEKGRVVFTTLDTGSYYIVVSAPKHQEGMVKATLLEGKNSSIVALQKGVLLSGTIEGPDGKPVEGVTVMARSHKESSGDVTPLSQIPDKKERTDARGRFCFDSLSNGRYTVVVFGGKEFASKPVRDITVPSGNLKISLGTGGAVTGVVRDDGGNPIQGAIVRIPDVAGNLKEAVTDKKGRYLIEKINVEVPDKKKVSVEAENYCRYRGGNVKLIEGKVVEENIQLELSSRIMGSVVDTAGKPVRNARILVELLTGPDSPIHRCIGFDRSKSDGSFILNDIDPASRVRLVAKHGRYLNWRSPVFDIGSGEDLKVKITLQTGGTVMGTVIDGAGKPLEDITVRLVPPGLSEVQDLFDSTAVRTDTAGKFTITGLRSGVYELLAMGNNYLPGRSKVIEITENTKRAGISITLQVSNTIAGVVKDSAGRGIDSATITVIDSSDGVRVVHAASGKNGQWEIEGLGGDPVEIEAEAKGYKKNVKKDVPVGRKKIEMILKSD